MMRELYLAHHGVKGQKYGVRRWQYKDGSLTPEGYIHYGYGKGKTKSEKNEISRMHSRSSTNEKQSSVKSKASKIISRKEPSESKNASSGLNTKIKNDSFSINLTDEQKRNLKIALGVTAAVAITAGALYYSKNKSFYSSELMSKKLSEDFVLKKGSKIQNLSFDSDRMNSIRMWRSNGDMLYTSHTARDNTKYMAYYATNPKAILEGKIPPLKYKLQGHMAANVKVASEKSGAAVFSDLFRTNDGFRDFVTDPSKMREYYVSRAPKQFSGYKEALKALDRVVNSSNPSDKDLRLVYRLFNYTIPSEEARSVRATFFSALKRNGYGALLDTNDALYGGFHSDSPVIIFDMEKVISDSVGDLKYSDVISSAVKNAINSASLFDASRKIYL